MAVNNGIFNGYTITPRTLTQYSAYRGVTDFSQIGQFNQYEKGYQFLTVIDIPKFMKKLGDQNSVIGQMNKNFRHTLEYEFRGLDGLPQMSSETFQITDGINTQEIISKVTRETSVEVSMSYFEKFGSMFEKYSEYYLTGIKDPMTQAKTYHGLIASGELAPGLENEVFTLMYYATDSTMLRLERAVLLANAQITNAASDMYNGTRADIGQNHEYTLSMRCFPIWGYEVDKAAKYLLEHEITSVYVTTDANHQYKGEGSADMDKSRITGKTLTKTVLDSADYRYGIMNPNLPKGEYNEDLANAVDKG